MATSTDEILRKILLKIVGDVNSFKIVDIVKSVKTLGL